ncbi:MAG: Universal stress protein family protein [Chloroflexi bacterium ADurb.Bin360]|nr:MAG: Universal stress protein family protein [Chloroflexi bacterium ADurb.Bin360]
MRENYDGDFAAAARDFTRARRAAEMERLLARLTGRAIDLISYEAVRKQLHSQRLAPRGLQDVPLEAIIGSVDRYSDFSRSFLPWHDSYKERWARVKMATEDMAGLPPVELYKVGSAYFVKDGHHRISVARHLGSSNIEAYVTEVDTPVPITPELRMEDLVLKGEFVSFLEATCLHEARPEANLEVTAAGSYLQLEEHIAVHRYFMGEKARQEIPFCEAAAHWYDTVYLPVAEAIREYHLLKRFPQRTEADLYLWVSEHRAELQDSLGWEVGIDEAASHLAEEGNPSAEQKLARLGARLLDAVVPDSLESGPPPGRWRENLDDHHTLFRDLLVPISGTEESWQALEQALEVAGRENGFRESGLRENAGRESSSRLRGLHVIAEGKSVGDTAALQARFESTCQKAGFAGQLVIEEGNIARAICERARWADLVILNLAHPPGTQPLAKLSSGFRTLMRRCACPILAVPRQARPLDSALLAYDGSPKAREGLFVAAYLASRWSIPLVVLTVMEGDRQLSETLLQAQNYLQVRKLHATFVDDKGPVGETILRTAHKHNCNLIIVGSYGLSPVVEVVLGSAVDQVLCESTRPVLICR